MHINLQFIYIVSELVYSWKEVKMQDKGWSCKYKKLLKNGVIALIFIGNKFSYFLYNKIYILLLSDF